MYKSMYKSIGSNTTITCSFNLWERTFSFRSSYHLNLCFIVICKKQFNKWSFGYGSCDYCRKVPCSDCLAWCEQGGTK